MVPSRMSLTALTASADRMSHDAFASRWFNLRRKRNEQGFRSQLEPAGASRIAS